ncbi:MAG: hypothetical protein LUI12_01860 [Clostridiales bacterium]|nr:hypothetical protein [Clostridiales bacterium]
MADEIDVTAEETTEDVTEDTSGNEETEQTMQEELIEDLTAELELSDKNFSATLLTTKVKAAIRDVQRVRNYPSYYTDEQIEEDLYNYYSNCRAIALYDYNKIGIDGADSHNENSVSTSFTDRDKLFAGVIPLSR